MLLPGQQCHNGVLHLLRQLGVPGSPKSWGLSFQINEQSEASGRAAGTLMWAGLSNNYFWIDPTNDVAGLMLGQILPFVDAQAIELFGTVEKTVYENLS